VTKGERNRRARRLGAAKYINASGQWQSKSVIVPCVIKFVSVTMVSDLVEREGGVDVTGKKRSR
jgi:hypothetical protein